MGSVLSVRSRRGSSARTIVRESGPSAVLAGLWVSRRVAAASHTRVQLGMIAAAYAWMDCPAPAFVRACSSNGSCSSCSSATDGLTTGLPPLGCADNVATPAAAASEHSADSSDAPALPCSIVTTELPSCAACPASDRARRAMKDGCGSAAVRTRRNTNGDEYSRGSDDTSAIMHRCFTSPSVVASCGVSE